MNSHTLSEALAVAEAAGSVHEAAAALRQRFAPLRVVVVDAAEMRGEAPAISGARRSLYFGASDGHCWTVTSDAARVAALFVTELA